MPSSLSPIETTLARSAPLLNAKLIHGKLVLNAPGGAAYWGVRYNGHDLLSPEAAIAARRGICLVWGAARGHSIPWADATKNDLLLVGGAGTHKDTVELVRIQESVAEWLGYKDRFEYAEACEQFPEDVARRIKEAP